MNYANARQKVMNKGGEAHDPWSHPKSAGGNDKSSSQKGKTVYWPVQGNFEYSHGHWTGCTLMKIGANIA